MQSKRNIGYCDIRDENDNDDDYDECGIYDSTPQSTQSQSQPQPHIKQHENLFHQNSSQSRNLSLSQSSNEPMTDSDSDVHSTRSFSENKFDEPPFYDNENRTESAHLADVDVQQTSQNYPLNHEMDITDHEDFSDNVSINPASGAHDNFDNSGRVQRHYDKLAEKIEPTKKRETSKIFRLRNYNNWVKTILIAQELNLVRDNRRVLEIGCGRGGEIKKYLYHDVKLLVGLGAYFYIHVLEKNLGSIPV
jgi:mRNA capping enzyme